MGRRKRTVAPLDTVWEVPDAAWDRLEKILAERYPPKKTGRPRADLRRVFHGIIYRLRSGVQWNHLPREFGDDSTVHRWFQRWAEDGVFEELWAVLLLECDELGGVEWKPRDAVSPPRSSEESRKTRGAADRLVALGLAVGSQQSSLQSPATQGRACRHRGVRGRRRTRSSVGRCS